MVVEEYSDVMGHETGSWVRDETTGNHAFPQTGHEGSGQKLPKPGVSVGASRARPMPCRAGGYTPCVLPSSYLLYLPDLLSRSTTLPSNQPNLRSTTTRIYEGGLHCKDQGRGECRVRLRLRQPP